MTEKGSEREDDLPKIVANIIAMIPRMTFKVGFRYLAMKRRVRKSARAMEAELRASGMPEHLAHRLSIRYEEDSGFIEIMIKNFMKRKSPRNPARAADETTGN